MFYTNKMTIRMANNNEAEKAMEITRTTIEANKKEYNKGYSFDTASEFVNAIQLQDNSLIIPDKQLGYFTPEDCAAFTDIINAIANQLKNSFEATIICSSDYSELWIDATCDGKELKRTFPQGTPSILSVLNVMRKQKYMKQQKLLPTDLKFIFLMSLHQEHTPAPTVAKQLIFLKSYLQLLKQSTSSERCSTSHIYGTCSVKSNVILNS